MGKKGKQIQQVKKQQKNPRTIVMVVEEQH
jgi:hypothetical protein